MPTELEKAKEAFIKYAEEDEIMFEENTSWPFFTEPPSSEVRYIIDSDYFDLDAAMKAVLKAVHKERSNMKAVKKWQEATDELSRAFVKRYFPEQEYNVDTYWVGDKLGGVFYVSGRLFQVDRMLEAFQLDATFEQINEYYDAELEHCEVDYDKPMPVNFKNFVKYGFKPFIENKE